MYCTAETNEQHLVRGSDAPRLCCNAYVLVCFGNGVCTDMSLFVCECSAASPCQPTLFILTRIHFILAGISTFLAADIVPCKRHNSSHARLDSSAGNTLETQARQRRAQVTSLCARPVPIAPMARQRGAECSSVSSSHPLLHTVKHLTAPRAPTLSGLAIPILCTVA